MANNIEDVQPLKTRQDIEDFKWALKKYCFNRDYIMFIIGINSGLRISDLLKLKTAEMKGKKSLKIQESKTGKPRTIHLDNIFDEIQSYIATNDSEWMFPSRQSENPISATQAYRQLQKAGKGAGIDSIGTHTMRKTFGYWHYELHDNIAQLQSILNHSSSQITLRYIGLTEEKERESIIAMNL